MIRKLNSVLKLKKRIGIWKNKMEVEYRTYRRSIYNIKWNNTNIHTHTRARAFNWNDRVKMRDKPVKWMKRLLEYSSSSIFFLFSPFFLLSFLHKIPFIFILSVLFELIKFKRCREEKKFNKLYMHRKDKRKRSERDRRNFRQMACERVSITSPMNDISH